MNKPARYFLLFLFGFCIMGMHSYALGDGYKLMTNQGNITINVTGIYGTTMSWTNLTNVPIGVTGKAGAGFLYNGSTTIYFNFTKGDIYYINTTEFDALNTSIISVVGANFTLYYTAVQIDSFISGNKSYIESSVTITGSLDVGGNISGSHIQGESLNITNDISFNKTTFNINSSASSVGIGTKSPDKRAYMQIFNGNGNYMDVGTTTSGISLMVGNRKNTVPNKNGRIRWWGYGTIPSSALYYLDAFINTFGVFQFTGNARSFLFDIPLNLGDDVPVTLAYSSYYFMLFNSSANTLDFNGAVGAGFQNHYLKFHKAGDIQFYQDVGIGTSSPDAPLEVSNKDDQNNLSIISAGGILADAYYEASDVRASDFLDKEGKINYSSHPCYAGEIEVNDYSKPIFENVTYSLCNNIGDCKNVTEEQQTNYERITKPILKSNCRIAENEKFILDINDCIKDSRNFDEFKECVI